MSSFGSGHLEPRGEAFIEDARKGAGDEPFSGVVGNEEKLGRLERLHKEGVAPDGRLDETAGEFDETCGGAMGVEYMRRSRDVVDRQGDGGIAGNRKHGIAAQA